MTRTTVSGVRDVFDTSISDSSLTAWIEVASDQVNDIAAEDASVPDGRLERIERLLTAHYASSQDKRVESTSRESASVTFTGEYGSGLESTSYGQAALELDPTGVLRGSGKPTASISVPDGKGLE